MTWLLIAVAAWMLVAAICALALGHAIRVAEERRRAYDSRLQPRDKSRPSGEPFVPSPRVPTDSEWRLPRGHRRSGAA